MEANGMRKNKKNVEAKPYIKVSLKILPFGSTSYETASSGHPMGKKELKIPRYAESLTTNIEKVEICYEKNEAYLVPKTTS